VELINFLFLQCHYIIVFLLYCCSKFPKTDYTYSRVSPHRKELAPGVIVMPNMSRRSLNTMRQHSWPENKVSSGTGVSVSKHDVTKSRWLDQTSSGRVVRIFFLLFICYFFGTLLHTRTYVINTFLFYYVIEKE
jgi:hypothetical protein